MVEVQLDIPAVAGEEVVETGDVVVLAQQELNEIGPDEARAAGDEDA